MPHPVRTKKKAVRFPRRGASPLTPKTQGDRKLRLELAQEWYQMNIESMDKLGLTRQEQMLAYRRALKGGKQKEQPSIQLMKRVWALGNLLSSWRRDRRYVDAAGSPRVLPIRGKGASLETLAKKFVPAMSVAEVLTAITRHGEATVYQRDKVVLAGTSALVTPKTVEMMLALLVNRIRRVTNTALHNAALPEGSKGQGHFERHVTGVLSERGFKEYARVMRSQLQDLCDRGEAGLELVADKKGSKRKTCGIGVFIFRDE